MDKVYIFLDYTNTTNDLLNNSKINQRLFDNFFKSLCLLEGKSNAHIRLVIATGNNEPSAIKLCTALKSAFDEKGKPDFLDGIAYEYGGYFLSHDLTSTQICKVENSQIDIKTALALSKQYDISPAKDYKTVLSFDTTTPTPRYMEFLEKIKTTLKNSKFVEFNDNYGCGIDIIPQELAKVNFVQNYLNGKSFSFVIVGGDGEEDFKMFELSHKYKTYFVGFSSTPLHGDKVFLSSQQNIIGITEAITNLANSI